MRELARNDLYFLIRYLLDRPDIEHPWLFDRCREVQDNPDGYLDLWAREHYKSTIITFGKTIQDLLSSHGEHPHPKWNGKEITVGIFSHTRPIAKGFLVQIMRELETNNTLKKLFPDIIWGNPEKDAPKWSEDGGIILKRKANPKESTVEAWGLVEGQPTSKHFDVMVYDDLITQESVRSPEMIKKTTDSWALSGNLGTRGGRTRYAGTRYNFNDTYRQIMASESAIPRIHPATVDGKYPGEPVFLSMEELEAKRKKGVYVFNCQQLQNPVEDGKQGFKAQWMKHYSMPIDSSRMNKCIIVDPANDKKKKSDYTFMVVYGLGSDQNYYVLDMIRDRLNLVERTSLLIGLHRKWNTNELNVGYEMYGKDSDIQHIEHEMKRLNYYFNIFPLGGSMGKNERIRRLVPDFESNYNEAQVLEEAEALTFAKI